MTLNQFVKDRSSQETPIGDFANDILGDNNYPSTKTEKEIFEYLDFQSSKGGTNAVFQEFVADYRKQSSDIVS